jgi:hypothetical protein
LGISDLHECQTLLKKFGSVKEVLNRSGA